MLCQYCEQDLPRFDLLSCHNNLLSWPKLAKHISHQHFDSLIAIAPYNWPFTQWLPAFKYHQNFRFNELFSSLMAEALEHYDNDWMLCPVPIHPDRWSDRGFNQANLLTDKISQQLNLKVIPNLIQKKEATDHQAKQSGVERRRNLKNSFQIASIESMPEKVIIVDDVITTGTTVNLIAKALKKAGVTQVDVVTLCLTLPH